MDRPFFYAALAIVVVFWGVWWLDYLILRAQVDAGPGGEPIQPRSDRSRQTAEAFVVGLLAFVGWILVYDIEPGPVDGPAPELLLVAALATVGAAVLFRSQQGRAGFMGLRTGTGLGYAALVLALTAYVPLLEMDDGMTTLVQVVIVIGLLAAEAGRLIANTRESCTAFSSPADPLR